MSADNLATTYVVIEPGRRHRERAALAGDEVHEVADGVGDEERRQEYDGVACHAARHVDIVEVAAKEIPGDDERD